MKNLFKNPVFYLLAIFILGGLTAVASVAKCGAPCDFVAAQATDLSAAIVKAKAEQANADHGEAAMPVPGAPVNAAEVQ